MRQGSQELFARSLKVIPGGVNSPVRAFRGVGGTPVFIARGHGATITDVDGNDYIDYVGSWGPLILGHASPVVVAAVQETAAAGLSFGAPTQREAELAELICRLMPSIEQVRLVNSGTEATMSAVRLARAATGRDLILKFEGCYHGHVDSLLVAAGSGLLTLGAPDSPGVPRAVAELTHVLPYNDLQAVEDLFAAVGNQIAAVIVEPVAGNMGCIPPLPEFLPGLRSVCDRFGALLIFDEVMTGFRVVLGGAQALYGAKPDLTTLGKVIGGGLPVGAFGGRTDLMSQMAPSGAVYQAGTLSGNPLATAAGLATLREVSQPGFFESLRERTQALCQGLTDAARGQGIELQTRSVGAMFGLFFTGRTVLNCLADVRRCDTERYARFFHAMLKEGVYLAPSAFESGFVSVAHSQAVIDATLAAAGKAFQSLG